MGYSDLIDRLLDTRIREGMISSIGKNKETSEDIDSLCSALLHGLLIQVPTKHIDIRETHYYNKSPFDSDLLRYAISTEPLDSKGGRDFRIYRMIKGDDYYFMISRSSVDRTYTRMKRCVIHKCDNEEVANITWDSVNRKSLRLMSVDSSLRCCDIVANTYRAFDGNAIVGSFKSKGILNDTKSVMDAMFNDAVNCMKSLFGSGYENFISRLVDNCSMYLVRLDGTTLSMYFEFDDEDTCSTLHGELKKGLGSNSTDFYNIFKRSNTEIGIEFFF